MRPPGSVKNLARAGLFYDQLARIYDSRFSHPSFYSKIQAKWIARHCRKGPLLDLGCGTGRMLRRLRDRGFDPVGVDCAPAMLAQARRKHPEAKLVRADASLSLPFADASFDTVISLHATVIHIPEWNGLRRLASEVHRVLRPRGKFIVELPHPATFVPPEDPPAWLPYTDDIDYCRQDERLIEMRVPKFGCLTTIVRMLEINELPGWLEEFYSIDLFTDFSARGTGKNPDEILVVAATKAR